MVQQTWRLMRLTFVAAIVLVLVVGCGNAQPQATPASAEPAAATGNAAEELATAYPLAATAWDLDYFGPPEQSSPLLPTARATVVYFWDRYAGFDGCNWFLGVYSATPEGELRMESPSRTAYPNQCGSAELNEQSARYIASLLNTVEYQLEGGQLIANAAQDQRLLTYSPAKPVPMPGTEWRLELWWRAGLRLWEAGFPGVITTITFGEGREASGSGGCNSYTVSYEGDLQIEKVIEATDTYAELPTLTFGPVAAQKMTCAEPEGIMEQEQAYFTTLDSIAYYFKLGGMLMMLDAEGIPLLIFSAPN